MESSSFLGSVFAEDEELQVALRVAAGLAGDQDNVFHLEKSLARAVRATERIERILTDEMVKNRTNITSKHFSRNESVLHIIQSDLLWKQELLDAIPIPASPEQLIALATFIRTRPWLGKLVSDIS